MDKWNDIIDALRAFGLTAVAPAYRTGICTSPYCVVQQCGGIRRNPKGGSAKYRVHVKVPAADYRQLSHMSEEVRAALAPMVSRGELRELVTRSSTVVDDVFAAHSCYLEYASEYTG